jgi:hypothetical protein
LTISQIDEWEALSACLRVGYKKILTLPDENLRKANAGTKRVDEAMKKVEFKILSAAVNDSDALLNGILLSQTFLTPPPGLFGHGDLPVALLDLWQPILAAVHADRQLTSLIARLHAKGTKLASLWISYLLNVIIKLNTAQAQLREAGLVIKEVPSLGKFVHKRKIAQNERALETKVKRDLGLGSDWPLLIAAPTVEEMNKLLVEIASTPSRYGRLYLHKYAQF